MDRGSVTLELLRAAVTHGRRGESSDYDLHPELRAKLAPGRALREAAVLCPVVDRGDGLRVILTRRADHLRQHAGQVAFPGGRMDPGDASLLHAALREAREEIGLGADEVEVLGEIDGHETVTGYSVSPFVALVNPRFAPAPDASEVAEVFEPPLEFLMNPANHRKDFRIVKGVKRTFYAMPWEGRYIWGATARMLVGLSERMASVAPRAAHG
ncbi:MAG: CoA pyrophosphatase [Pseudomonadota bacterium]